MDERKKLKLISSVKIMNTLFRTGTAVAVKFV